MQSPYELHISALKLGTHNLEYLLDNDFFKPFNQHYSNVQIKIDVVLEKKETFLEFKFVIAGIIETQCERCTNNFPLEIWDEFQLIVKYDTNALQLNEEEEDPDIVYILPHEAFFNLEQHLYEFMMLSMPLIVRCSDQQFEEKIYCNQDVLKYISNTQNE